MTDDIKAIRDALQAVNFYKKGGFSYNAHEFQIAANPLRIARLLDALEQAQADVQRLENLSHCGCGDQFTTDEPGRCAICVMMKGQA